MRRPFRKQVAPYMCPFVGGCEMTFNGDNLWTNDQELEVQLAALVCIFLPEQ